MRRRAIIAASIQQGGAIDTTLTFPLTLEWDYCEQIDPFSKVCTREADDTGKALFLLITQIVQEHGDRYETVIEVTEETLNSLGVEVSVGETKIIGVLHYHDADIYEFTDEDGNAYIISSDGRIEGEFIS